MFSSRNIVDDVVDGISLLREPEETLKINNNTRDKVKLINYRLESGKKEFTHISQSVLSSVIQMSSLDLQLKDKQKVIKELTDEINSSMFNLTRTAGLTNTISQEVKEAHAEVTNSISALSENTSELLQISTEVETGLEDIKDCSESAKVTSSKMKDDLSGLLDIVENVQQLVAAINAISDKTNLLALNASIEAARAGESGKGFAVVAEEIKKLAEESKLMTSGMDKFMETIKEASAKCTESVDNTVDTLENINNSLSEVVEKERGNVTRINNITHELNRVAASTEKVDASFQEVAGSMNLIHDDIEKFNRATETLTEMRDGLESTITPISSMESELHSAAVRIGKLSKDRYYMMDNAIFKDSVEKAISAHRGWLKTLQNIVTNRNVIPLQVDEHKCGFGHFYYSMTPSNQEVLKIWKELEHKHRTFHNYGREVIAMINSGNVAGIDRKYSEAVSLSEELIHDFETIIGIVTRLDKENKNVYEVE